MVLLVLFGCLFPIIGHPGGSFDVSVPLAPTAVDRLVWIYLPMENDYFCPLRYFRGLPEIERYLGMTVVFETGAPGIWPILKQAFFVDGPGKVFLLVAMLFPDLVKILDKIIEHIGVFTNFKAIHGGVACDPPELHVGVFDDEELAFQVKKGVQAVHNHHVQVQEQGSAL
jgi:hypothetical protein